jgi:hypothetical protein
MKQAAMNKVCNQSTDINIHVSQKTFHTLMEGERPIVAIDLDHTHLPSRERLVQYISKMIRITDLFSLSIRRWHKDSLAIVSKVRKVLFCYQIPSTTNEPRVNYVPYQTPTGSFWQT